MTENDCMVPKDRTSEPWTCDECGAKQNNAQDYCVSCGKARERKEDTWRCKHCLVIMTGVQCDSCRRDRETCELKAMDERPVTLMEFAVAGGPWTCRHCNVVMKAADAFCTHCQRARKDCEQEEMVAPSTLSIG